MHERHNEFKIGFSFCFGLGTILSDRRASRNANFNGHIMDKEMKLAMRIKLRA